MGGETLVKTDTQKTVLLSILGGVVAGIALGLGAPEQVCVEGNFIVTLGLLCAVLICGYVIWRNERLSKRLNKTDKESNGKAR